MNALHVAQRRHADGLTKRPLQTWLDCAWRCASAEKEFCAERNNGWRWYNGPVLKITCRWREHSNGWRYRARYQAQDGADRAIVLSVPSMVGVSRRTDCGRAVLNNDLTGRVPAIKMDVAEADDELYRQRKQRQNSTDPNVLTQPAH